MASLAPADKRRIGELFDQGYCPPDIAAAYGVSTELVEDLLDRRAIELKRAEAKKATQQAAAARARGDRGAERYHAYRARWGRWEVRNMTRQISPRARRESRGKPTRHRGSRRSAAATRSGPTRGDPDLDSDSDPPPGVSLPQARRDTAGWRP
jgi:hypothetical protein